MVVNRVEDGVGDGIFYVVPFNTTIYIYHIIMFSGNVWLVACVGSFREIELRVGG